MNVLHYKLRNLQCLMIVFDLSRTECSLRDEYFAWQTQKCSVRDDSGSFVPYPTWITTRGLKEEDMPVIVDMIDSILCDIDNTELIANVKKNVNEMMNDRPMFAW